MKNKSLILLLLAFVLASGTADARKRVFNLADEAWGVAPGADALGAKLRQALLQIRAQVGPDDEVVLRLKPGRYDFHAADAEEREYYVSNHDQGQPKHVAVCLEGWSNLTLDGGGAELVCHGRMLPLALVDSRNCRLRNLSIDFANPHIAQVEVVSNDGDEGITFRVAPWVEYRIAANGRFETYGEGWTLQPSAGIAFEKDTRHIVYNTSDIGIDTRGVKEVGERLLAAPHWRDARLKPGTVVAMRTWDRPAPGIFLDNSVNTTVQNVRVHYAEGMGLLAQRCTDIALKGFSVCLKGDTDPRYFTTQADATHFSQCRGSITSTGGLYEGMMDDAINVHGVYLKVCERIGSRTLRCRYMHYQAWGFAWGNVGDSVAFVRSATMDKVGADNAIAAIRPADTPTDKGVHEFLITFCRPVPDEVCAEQGYGVENLTWTPEVTFKANTVRNNRARGALFSSPRRTVCEDNLFDHTSGTAILLCGDCNGWYESGAVRQLVIRNNRFVNALTNMFQFTNAVISIYPEIPNLDGQEGYFHGGSPDAIVIESNEFDTFDAPLLYAKSVNGLVFRNNTLRRNADYKPFHWNRKPVLLERVSGAQVEEPKER